MSAIATIRPTPPTNADASTPRKRRKRAPAAGAAADCFTCSERGHICDRRRPYCSQCLDNGRDCAGYKTQLTWGVGVASRGKLRGLSLPIAGTQKVAGATSKPRHRASASVNSVTSQYIAPPVVSLPSPDSGRSNGSTHREKHSTSPPLTSPFPPAWETPIIPQHSMPTYQPGYLSESPVSPMAFSFPPVPTSGVAPAEQTFPRYRHERMRSMPSLYPSPISEAPAYTVPPPLTIPIPPPQLQSGYIPFTPFDSAFDQFSPHGGQIFPQQDESYLRSNSYNASSYQQPELYQPPELVSQPPAADPARVKEEAMEDVEEIGRQDLVSSTAVFLNPSPLNPGLGLNLSTFASGAGIGATPRLQYLINYYSEVISPVIVAFDGASNPFRTHILRLAGQSDALQHAIAALASSNLRQRRESGALSTCKTDPARRSSMAHLTLADAWHEGALQTTTVVGEETHFKNYAVSALNLQLADPNQRKEDSTLAILLILCLFHMCDSGVAKFATQFQGVRKLLSLRKAAQMPESEESKFFMAMFAWFDGVTSSVNEREGEFGGTGPPPTIDGAAMSNTTPAWSLANISGCDPDLFRIISRLGRLNMLSQGRPAESGPIVISRPPPVPTTVLSSEPVLTSNDVIDMKQHHAHLDGNGWGFALPDVGDSKQEQFRRELAETQHLLLSWSVPAYSSATSTLTLEQHDDLCHISSTFQFSALLYLERLANPSLPSSSPQIQRWVRSSLDHVREVKSDVYLLWPLFVTGSECIGESEREEVRTRVREIQRDSGFRNNEVVGGVLEGVWRKMDAEMDGEKAGFRFKEVMRRGSDGGNGEYIVV